MLRMRLSLLFVSLCLLRVPFLIADEAPPTGFAKWEKEIAAFEAADQKNPPVPNGIVFVGSSSIRMWKTLAEDFPQHRVLNRGFGGSQIADAVHFADRIVIPYQPRMVVLYSGGNDIAAGKSAEQVIADFKAFVSKIRTALPKAEIAYISVAGNPKRWAQLDKVKAVNAAAEAHMKEQPGCKFINVFPHMLGEDGLPKPHIFLDDQLHMNAEGYKIWAEVVRPFLPAPDLTPE